MKVYTLTLVTVLCVFGASSAVKIRRAEKRSSLEETKPTEDDTKTDIIEADTDKTEKEVHKRGILHYGNGFASASAHGSSFWPRTYASHYGYGLNLPAASAFSAAPLAAAHVHAPSALRYNNGFHYKTLAAPAYYSGVSSLPTYASASPAVSYGHHAVASPAVSYGHHAVASPAVSYGNHAVASPAVSYGHHAVASAATAQPFIIRPGGAVVQSYSVNYPHHKPAVAVKPVHTFASVSPVQHLHPVQAVQSVQPVQHAFQTVQHIQPVQQTFQTVQPAQPLQPVQPVHHHIQPVQPVQSVVQTSFVQPQPAQGPAISQPAPAVPFTPAQPSFPSFPGFPGFPAIPQFPNPPAFPNIPSPPATPAVPSLPAFPNIPTIPSIPNFPQPQVPTNGFFPVSVQPPLPQQPPPFGSFNPSTAQFPGFGPVAGTPNHNNPDFGSAEAAPLIPVQQPEPNPEPELPTAQPQPTQQPWKPVFYQPPTAESPGDRPSHTLLPPYGNSPAEGYLPPGPSSSNSHKVQQEYTIDSRLFDNLSDADIQNIFAQANAAAQHDHDHHTVHNYHSSHYKK